MPAFPDKIMMIGMLALCMVACTTDKETSIQTKGLILNKDTTEISGIAVSRIDSNRLWVHNDSGDAATLYALNENGKLVSKLPVHSAINTDWEDISSFMLEGEAYLVIADTGDNGGLRHSQQLYVFKEPKDLTPELAEKGISPSWSINFVWPDGPRDCEAIAVDTRNNEILLISKKRYPAEVFSVPLLGTPHKVITAKKIATLAGVPASPSAGSNYINSHTLDKFSQITAADISSDNSKLAVLSYNTIYIYQRADNQSWTAAVQNKPVTIAYKWMPQAEALAWDEHGKGFYMTSEFSPAPLVYVRPALH